MNYKLFIASVSLCLCVLASLSTSAQDTFRNPVIWSDLPDPDVIRVEDTFYFVSTSMHFFPGVTILQSKDLVNW